MKALIITQARLASSRLPGKVLRTVANIPLIDYQLSRLQKSGSQICVATTTSEADDTLFHYLTDSGRDTFRGSETDVLSRFYECALSHSADVIVRVTSDCPLIDGQLIQKSLDTYLKANDPSLYLSNTTIRTFPRGFDFEIFSFHMLEHTHQTASELHDREHVTTLMRRFCGSIYRNIDILFPRDVSHFRITVDEEVDFMLVEKLLRDFQCHEKNAEEIIAFLEIHPELVSINQTVEQKKSLGST